MARGASDDEDERFGRTATLIEKSDHLAREYSREREIRQQAGSRARRLDLPPGTDAENRSLRSRSREAAPDEGTEIAPPPRPPREAREAREPREPRELKDAPPAARDPSRARPKTGERPAVRTPTPPAHERAEPLPSAPPVAPRPPPPAPRSALDDLAVELEELVREMRFGWRALSTADRVTTLAAISVLAGVLMPWVSDPAHSLRVGLLSGGVIHFALAVMALVLLRRSSALRGLRMTRRDEVAQHRRISLWLVLLGAASTLAGAYLLLLYGVAKTDTWPVQLHFGLYWTLVSGTGLSYGGYARFSDVQR